MCRFVLLLLCSLSTSLLFAQAEMRGDLARRAYLGIDMASEPGGRTIIRGVQPGESAAKAGLRRGDILRSLGGVEAKSGAAFAQKVGRLRAGDQVNVEIDRDGKALSLEMTLGARPTERAEDFDIVYDAVAHGEAKLRSITTRPRGKGRHPAIYFIQGLPATSTEFFPGQTNPVQELLYGLTRRGFATFRCEKSGCGDSTGIAAADVGFKDETEGFRRGLAKLKSYDFVDPDRVYIFGHSMGGIMGPLIAPKDEVAGMVVYGTGIRPWTEYMISNLRRQMKLTGMKASAADDMLRAQQKFHHLTLVEKWSLARVTKERSDLVPTMMQNYPDGKHYATRSLAFFQELQDVNLPRAWEAVTVPVLAIHGEYDWVSSAADHRSLVEVVNAAHPGQARFLSLERSFHGFDQHATLEASLKAPFQGSFNANLVDEVVKFCTPAKAR